MGSFESKSVESPTLIGGDSPSTVDKKALVQTMNTCMTMHMFRSSEYLCNITLKVADRIFYAHQTILACHSQAFKRLIQQEDQLNKHIFLKLNNIDPYTFQKLLDYVYTGKINIDACNIMSISMAAQKLEMDSVLKLCRNFIKKMNIEEAMAIIEIEPNPPCNKVFRCAINYLLYNYQKVYKHDLFDKLSVNKVNYLLSHDSLVVEWEIQVLDGILKWIYYDVVNRVRHFQRLVKTVRFHVMSGTELKILPFMSQLTKDYYQKVLSNCPVIDSICKNGKLHHVAKCVECKPRKPEPQSISLEKKRTGMNMDNFLLHRGNSTYKIPSKPVLWCFTSEALTLIKGACPDYEAIEKTDKILDDISDKTISNDTSSTTTQSQNLEVYTDWLLKTCDDFPGLPNQIERSLSLQHLNCGDGTESIRMTSSVVLNTDSRLRNILASSDEKNLGILKKMFRTECSTSRESGTGDFTIQTEPNTSNTMPSIVCKGCSNSDSNTIAKVERLLEDVNRICERLNRVYGSETPSVTLSNDSLIERNKEANITTIEKVETILLNVQRMRQRATELGSESTISTVSDSDQMKTKVELEQKEVMPHCSYTPSVTYPKNRIPPELNASQNEKCSELREKAERLLNDMDPYPKNGEKAERLLNDMDPYPKNGIPPELNAPQNEKCSELREKAERLLNDMDQIFDRLKNRPENEETLERKAETDTESNVTPTYDKDPEITGGYSKEVEESADDSDKGSLTISKYEEQLRNEKVGKNPVISVFVTNSSKDIHHEIRWVTTQQGIDSGSETSDTESSNYTDVSDE